MVIGGKSFQQSKQHMLRPCGGHVQGTRRAVWWEQAMRRTVENEARGSAGSIKPPGEASTRRWISSRRDLTGSSQDKGSITNKGLDAGKSTGRAQCPERPD